MAKTETMIRAFVWPGQLGGRGWADRGRKRERESNIVSIVDAGCLQWLSIRQCVDLSVLRWEWLLLFLFLLLRSHYLLFLQAPWQKPQSSFLDPFCSVICWQFHLMRTWFTGVSVNASFVCFWIWSFLAQKRLKPALIMVVWNTYYPLIKIIEKLRQRSKICLIRFISGILMCQYMLILFECNL